MDTNNAIIGKLKSATYNLKDGEFTLSNFTEADYSTLSKVLRYAILNNMVPVTKPVGILFATIDYAMRDDTLRGFGSDLKGMAHDKLGTYGETIRGFFTSTPEIANNFAKLILPRDYMWPYNKKRLLDDECPQFANLPENTKFTKYGMELGRDGKLAILPYIPTVDGRLEYMKDHLFWSISTPEEMLNPDTYKLAPYVLPMQINASMFKRSIPKYLCSPSNPVELIIDDEPYGKHHKQLIDWNDRCKDESCSGTGAMSFLFTYEGTGSFSHDESMEFINKILRNKQSTGEILPLAVDFTLANDICVRPYRNGDLCIRIDTIGSYELREDVLLGVLEHYCREVITNGR